MAGPNLPLRGAPVTPFLTAEVARRCAARRSKGLAVVGMHFGQPSEGPNAAALAATRRALDGPDHGYWESAALRARLASYYRDRYGVSVTQDRILLTAGASAGLVGVFATAFAAGDRVAIACPGYPAYRSALRLMNLVPDELRVAAADGYRLGAARVAALDPAPQGLLLASPANPTGTVTDGPALAEMIGVCRERAIRFVSDEIYHGLSYGGEEHSALEYDDDVFVVGSFSKLFRMPGWRLGWLVVPPAVASTVHDALINLFLTPPTPTQHAALAAMETPADFAASVARYARNRSRLLDGLRTLGVTAPEPDGAFYVYADFSRYTRDSLRFCLRAVDEIGVGMAPGVDFDPEGGASFVRLCFAIDEHGIDTALAALAGWLPQYRD
jgi:aspartate/methionine/tyrosine aminotransferase